MKLKYSSIVLAFWSLLPLTSLAAGSAATMSDLVTFSTNTIKASSSPQVVAGLNLVASPSDTLTLLKVVINGTTSPLATATTATSSGIALYADNKATGSFGRFDSSDYVIPLSIVPRPIQVTSFSKVSPSATAAVTDTSMTINAGDVVFANTSANPTGGSYSWYMVTTASNGGVAGSALVLNGSGAQPTFVANTQFSKLTPAATAVGNGSTAGGTLTVAKGDLIFAKTATSSYGWHIVTNAGTVLSDDVTENTAALDSFPDDPAVLSGTTYSDFVPSGSVTDNGPGAGGTLTVAVGDLVFVKVVSLGAYAWHTVTTAGDLSSQAGEDTASLDGTTGAPGIAPGSQMSKISTSGGTFQIATALTNDTSLSLTTGDIAFAQTTTNPQQVGPGWEMVTTGATGVSNTALRMNNFSSAPAYGWVVRFVPSSPYGVPTDNAGNNAGDDFFVVLQSATSVNSGATMNFGMSPGSVTLGTGPYASAPSITAGSTLTVDTTRPTVSSVSPSNSSTNVPVSTVIHTSFSEDVAQNTINSTNVTLTAGGSPIGTGFRVFPTSFDINMSSAPTFAGSSRFAKVGGTSFSFFQINGSGQTINPQGGYSTPAMGDIVYFQHDTFPADLGLVTGANLVSGQFSVNNIALTGSQSITKFATPTVTGYATTTTTVAGVGDLMVANSTSSPTSDRYAWHIVRVSGAVNGNSIRLDDASNKPGYLPATYMSTLMPTATSTTDGSSQLTQGLVLSQGDLVFAKVTSNADNLNSFTWHLVTTGETVTAGAAPSALRLDGSSAAPTFAANSVVAKLTPGSQGASSDTSTGVSYGDIIMAKTSANALNNGSYAFHLASADATGISSSNLRFDNSSGSLNTSTTYTLTIGTGVTDKAGNGLSAPQVVTFTTGSTGTTNTTPPNITSSIPQSGNQSFALNGAIKLTFSVDMQTSGAGSVTNTNNINLFLDNFGGAGAAVSGTSLTYDSASKTVTLSHPNLAANTSYVVKVANTTTSSSGTAMNQYFLSFKTGASADTTAPTVNGVSPANSSAGVSRSVAVTAGFSKDMDPSTINTSTITLENPADSSTVAGTVSYSASSRGATYVPSSLLSASTQYRLRVLSGSSGVKDASGNQLAADYTSTFTTDSSSDTTAPQVSYATADNFGVAITFNEQVKTGGGPNAADNVANYTLQAAGASVSLGGKTVTYDAPTRTAKISGLSLANGTSFNITVANQVQDLAGNNIDTSGSPARNVAYGTVQNSNTTGGSLGPGGGSVNQSQQGMNPTRVSPMVRLAGATSDYKVEFPTSTAIPSTGQIVLTFPNGFSVSNVAAQSTNTSFCNKDIDGPGGSNTVTMSSVVGNSSDNSVTITTTGGATGASSFICLDLTGIINSTIPSSSGYTVDIKTKDTAGNNRALLESKTTGAFFLGSAGSRTLTINVFKDDGAGTPANAGNGTKEAGEGLANATVFLFSPATGGQSTTTSALGVARFLSLADGDYQYGVMPGSISGAAFNSAPQQIHISADTTKNFAIGASTGYTISGTVTGTNGTKVDVFGSSPTGFSKTSLTLTGGADAYTLQAQASTTYQVGVGPAMADTTMIPGAPPPPMPTFTFMPPPNLTVTVTNANVTGKNFTLSSADKTISGTVLDANGTGVSNAGVFCRPVQTSTGGSANGFGTGAQTDTSGAFSVKVNSGIYLCGVFKPGMPSVPDKQITVPSSGSNSPSSLAFTLDAGTSLTISGTISDDSGNAVPYAGVSARKVTSTSDTTALGGGTQNFVGGPADANGAYTLYVDAGTWVIEAFAPGFGRLGSKTVTVSTASLSGQDFSAQTLNMATISGSATAGGTGQQGVGVRITDGTNANFGVTDTSGNYSIKVPAGTYSVVCYFPNLGEVLATSSVPVSANSTASNKNCSAGSSITLTVKLTDGTNPITNAFVDARDSNGRGNGTGANTTSGIYGVYTLTVPSGTYTVRAGNPTFGQLGSTASVSSTQTITYTAAAGTTFAVTGTVQANSAALSGAWVSIRGTPTGQTNFINVGAQSGSDGSFTINVPAGSYKIRADKPSYKSPAESDLTVAAAKSVGTITLTTASRTISGTVTLSGSGVSGAFIDANDGNGGYAVAQSDSSGAYSLAVDNGTWTVHARSIGYESADTSVTVAGNNPTQNLTLSAISGFTVKAERQENVTPSAGGFITNTDIGDSFKLNIPANALGTGSNAGTVKTQANTAVPKPSAGSVLAKNAVTISATDNSGSPIKNLNDSITVVVPYDESAIPTGATENDLVLAVWNDATNQYDSLPTTVDTVNNTLTAVASHLSDFAPIVPSTSNTTTTTSNTTTTTTNRNSGGAVGSISYSPASAATTAPTQKNNTEITATVKKGQNIVGTVRVSNLLKSLRLGQRSSTVIDLQKVLNSDPDTIVSQHGAGSPGHETELLGPMTIKAIKKFQLKYKIAAPGQSGYGVVGPKTLAKLNSLALVDDGEAQQLNSGSTQTIVLTTSAKLQMINDLIAQVKTLQSQLDAMKKTQ